MSKVYLVPGAAGDSKLEVTRQVERLWRAAQLDEVLQRRDLTAVKIHVGEPGTQTFMSPVAVRAVVEQVAATGAVPFVTDTAVLYRSPRDHAVGHIRVAHDHGFSLGEIGAPFICADGLNGADEVEVPVDGKHFGTVAIASGILRANSMVVISHATGHVAAGFGGALKNLGMGCCSKKAKLRQHHGQQPRVAPDRCTGCAACVDWCPREAITVEESAHIDDDACIGCGECIAVCREGAVRFDWGIHGAQLQERIVEHAAAIVRRRSGRLGFVTLAQNITKDCDCLGLSQQGLLPDIGLLASRDPVAIDQAVLDLVRERAGATLESLAYPRTDATVQLSYAESLGLGCRKYELVEL